VDFDGPQYERLMVPLPLLLQANIGKTGPAHDVLPCSASLFCTCWTSLLSLPSCLSRVRQSQTCRETKPWLLAKLSLIISPFRISSSVDCSITRLKSRFPPAKRIRAVAVYLRKVSGLLCTLFLCAAVTVVFLD